MNDILHLLSLKNIKEEENYIPLQKSNWEKNSHAYRVVHEKYITYIYIYNTGLDQLVK